LGREYPESEDVSFLDQVISIAGRQPLYSNLDLEVRASFEEAFLRSTGEFRTQRAIGPAFLFQATRDVQVRLWGDWTDASYYESVPDPEKRSGTYSRLGITFAIDLGRAWALGPYGIYNKEKTTGSDYDGKGWEIGVQVTSPEYAGFKATALLGYGEETYSNPNSLTGFLTKRQDRPFTANLTITFKQVEKWVGYAPTISVGFVRHESNLSDFNYTRWTPQIEVSLGVLAF
jgi:hypothetical protein